MHDHPRPVEGVNRVTESLFQKYRTPQDYLEVPASELAEDIKPTGFFNQKARSLRGAAQRIVEVYDGRVPDTMEDLITLPGVARKTANIANAYDAPELARLHASLRFDQRWDKASGFKTTQVLSTPILPSISSTSRLQITRPMPVPGSLPDSRPSRLKGSKS